MENFVQTEAVIDMPRPAVWEKLRDLSKPDMYVPGVTRCEFTTPAHEGVGASRRVYVNGRPPLDETVVEWNDGYGFTLRLHNGDKEMSPFKAAKFVYRIEDSGPAKTKFVGQLRYVLPDGFFWRLFDRLVFQTFGARSTAPIGANIKRFYETGQKSN